MPISHLLLGGNLGHREAHLEAAMHAIAATCGRIMKHSAVYETEAWGLEDQPSFLNQAIELDTPLTPAVLLQNILSIERMQGRTRDRKYGPRAIDIDILFYEAIVLKTEELTVPHPHIAGRRFALQCMFDIAPDLVHPVSGSTITEMLRVCEDPLAVWKYEGTVD